MGHFTQLNDDDAELLSGGVKPANPSTAYNPGGKLGRNK
jgi:hypothetical protein